MSTTIYWFSGTGNSLYAAKKLTEHLGGELYPMASGITPESPVGGEGEKIGFVFPSYFGNLPRVVRSFMESLAINYGTYLFSVVTKGGAGSGSIRALDIALKEKGHVLAYGKTIGMPANYLLKYDPARRESAGRRVEAAGRKLEVYAAEIISNMRAVEGSPVIASNLYKNIPSLDKDFWVADSCTSCGLCERICPVRNIRMMNGSPEWLHHCEHCVACISYCPAEAIQFAGKTKRRRRYRNPFVSIDELAAQSHEKTQQPDSRKSQRRQY